MVKLITIIFLSCFLGTAFAATVPTGIPEPPFGLDETVANTVGSGDNNYYTYWIDESAGNCTDTSNPNGSPSSPRCTIPSLSSLSPGDVVQIRGSYTLSSDLTITGTGTSGSPIFVRGDSTSNRTSIDLNSSYQIDINGDYVVFENFSLSGRDRAVSMTYTDYCVIRYVDITGTGTNQGNGAVIAADYSNYLVRAHNSIHDAGNYLDTSQNDMHGFATGWYETYTWDLYNTCYHVGGDCSGNSHDANHNTHHLYIGGNTFYEPRENPIDLKEVNDVVISENHLYNVTESPGGSSVGAPGEAIVLHYGPTTDDGPYNVWVINNHIHDAVYGIVTSDVGTGIYAIGNVIYDCDIGINPDRGGGNFYAYHNTVVDCDKGISSGGSGDGSLDTLDSHGNISAYATTYNLEVYNSVVRSNSTIDHELYYNGGANLGIYWGTTYTSISAWNTAETPIGDDSSEANPGFTNYAGNDFSLTADIDGYNMASVMSTFYSAFGAYINKDIAGTTRPSGVWTQGAYEFDGGSTSSTGSNLGSGQSTLSNLGSGTSTITFR